MSASRIRDYFIVVIGVIIFIALASALIAVLVIDIYTDGWSGNGGTIVITLGGVVLALIGVNVMFSAVQRLKRPEK